MKKIKYVQVDLMSANGDSHTYIVGDNLRLTPKGFCDNDEIIESIKFVDHENDTDLVITTDKGSVVSFNPKYVISWGIN